LLGEGEYVQKIVDEGVIWYVAPESSIHKDGKGVSETLNSNESIP